MSFYPSVVVTVDDDRVDEGHSDIIKYIAARRCCLAERYLPPVQSIFVSYVV